MKVKSGMERGGFRWTSAQHGGDGSPEGCSAGVGSGGGTRKRDAARRTGPDGGVASSEVVPALAVPAEPGSLGHRSSASLGPRGSFTANISCHRQHSTTPSLSRPTPSL